MKIKIILVFVAALFISIFFHEMGHCLALRHNGMEVEKVSVGAVWKMKLTVFTDSRGTQYEVGPLPLFGYTQPKDDNQAWNLVKVIEIYSAGVSVNAIIVLFLTFWYFLLRKLWRRRNVNFAGISPELIFKVFIRLNFVLLVGNLFWLTPSIDGGKILYFILSERFGAVVAFYTGFVLGIFSFLYLFWLGIDYLLRLVDKIYGWTGGWFGSR